MGRRDVQVGIKLNIDGSKQVSNEIGKLFDVVRQATKQVDDFDKKGGLGRMATGGDRIRKAQADIAALSVELLDAENAAEKLRQAIAQAGTGSDSLGELTRELTAAENRAANAADAIARIPVELREAGRASVGFLGDIDTSLQTFAGTLTSIGGGGGVLGRLTGGTGGAFGGLAKGLQIAGDLAAAAEQLPLMSSALGTLRQRLVEGIASQGGYAKAITAGVKAVGPFVAAMAAYIAVLKVGEFASKQARGPLVGLFSDLDNNLSQLDVAGKSADELRELVKSQEAYQRSLEENANTLRFVNDGYDDANNAGQRVAKGFANVADSIGVFENPINEVRSRLSETETQLDATNKELQTLNAELERAEEIERRLAIQARLEATRAAALLELTDGLTTSLELEKEFNALRQQGAEAVVASIASWREEAAITNDVFAQEFGKIADEIVNQNLAGSGTLFSSRNTELATEFFQSLSDGVDSIDEARELLAVLSSDTQLSEAQREAVSLLEQQVAAYDELNEKADLAEKELLPLATALDQSAQSAERLVTAQEDVANAQRDLSDFLKNRAAADIKEARRGLQTSALEQQIAAAKAIEAEQARQTKIQSIIDDGSGKITAAFASLANDNAKAVRDLSKKENDVNRKFMDSELKQVESFRRDQLKADKEHAKARVRILDDMNANLLQASLDNDVNAFLAAQQSGETELQRVNEDAQAARDERAEQFLIEREEARNQRTVQLQDLRVSFEEERRQRQATAQQRVNEIRAETQQRIEQERASQSTVLKESERLQQELAALRAQFQEQDKKAQRAIEENAFRQRLTEAQTREQKLLTLTGQSTKAQVSMVGSALNFVQKAAAATANILGSLSGGKKSTVPRFANEGVVKGFNPTLGIFGDVPSGESEAIIRFRDSEGLPRSLARRGLSGGGRNIQVTINNTVGDIATVSMLQSQLTGMERRIAGHILDLEMGGAS